MVKKDAKKRIIRMRERANRCFEYDQENRRKMVEDLKFTYEDGAQWDDYTKRERGDDRPMYQFNRTKVTVARIVNDMRANRPQGKVHAFEDSDKDTADVMEGLCRSIANSSQFEAITDEAATYQVAGGYAAWRISPEYSADTAFDQDLYIRKLRNPLCLYKDPESIDITGADAKYWILTDKLSVDTFKETYPKADAVSFESDSIEFDDNDDWDNGETVRVCEYWWQEPYKKQIHLMSDGKTIEDEDLQAAMAQGLQVVKTREVECQQIWSAIYSGNAELTEPAKYPGKIFPWVTTYGDLLIIEGKVTWGGIVRNLKDPQRAFNLAQTSIIESVAGAPITPFWATPTQAEGMQNHWAEVNKKRLPAAIYNPDPLSPGPPVRMGGADVPVAFTQLSLNMADEIKADSGIFDSSLGAQSNETSGRAIAARQRQGEIATFNYPDNMAKAVARTWKILIDAIPHYYDTPRSLRILGPDLAEKFVKINQPSDDGKTIYDLTRGKYDVTVTVGPSFSTQRQEAVDAYTMIAQANPALTQVAGDIMFKAMDLPYAEQIAERMKAILPPNIQQMIDKDKPMSPEAQQAMMKVDIAMQQVQQQGMLVQQAAEELEQERQFAIKEKSAAEKAKSDLIIQMEKLKVAEAQFQAEVAKAEADIEVQMVKLKSFQRDGTEVADYAIEQVSQAVQLVHAQAAKFAEQVAEAIATEPQPPEKVVIEPPKPVSMSTKRVDGNLVGVANYSDGSSRQIKLSRVDGNLVADIQEVPPVLQ